MGVCVYAHACICAHVRCERWRIVLDGGVDAVLHEGVQGPGSLLGPRVEMIWMLNELFYKTAEAGVCVSVF